jgi:FlaA1/EpsC-like NDP-sugar epimerase
VRKLFPVRLPSTPLPLRRGPRQALILAADALLMSVAFYAAFLVRFDGQLAPERVRQFWTGLPVLLLIRLTAHVAFGIHRWSFRLSGFHEALRLIQTCFTGSACFAAFYYFRQRAADDFGLGPPRAVMVVEFLLTTGLIGALRFSRRLLQVWSQSTQRALPRGRLRTLIVGAGNAGELLLRDLQRSSDHPYQVLGFVDDQPTKWGTTIGGQPVLGGLSDLPQLAPRWRVRQLLFAIHPLPAERLREVLALCAGLKLRYKVLPLTYAYLNDRMAGAALQDLAPEDLLPRVAVEFDDAEVRSQVEGRRVLVTGAGGSIGREACRQLARMSPARLVMVDTHENDLYLLSRELAHAHPGLALSAEVVDLRDGTAVHALGRRARPHHVFHAAAHKHVPLMEAAPEESVKTNVTGCRHVAAMAVASRAVRFTLISTDKAVLPAGVMGATKLLAELLVRELAEGSATSFTTVRFGNVLGSAGSVVPLFKAQIAAGGPVTVTHPDCRRFLMTLGEAVGLVLRAGTLPYGDLCVLEMGEPMRILDLAGLMITMSGLVPHEEIPIVFMGLRPGEKLEEQLMTSDEAARSRVVHPAIRAVSVARPPAELTAGISALEAAAWAGARERVLELLGELVPSFAEARNGPVAAREAHPPDLVAGVNY